MKTVIESRCPNDQAIVGPLTLLRRAGDSRVVCSTGHLTLSQGYRWDGTLSGPHRTDSSSRQVTQKII